MGISVEAWDRAVNRAVDRAEAGTLRADVVRLRGAGGGLVSRSGKPRDKVMEGVWDPTRTLIFTQTPTPA